MGETSLHEVHRPIKLSIAIITLLSCGLYGYGEDPSDWDIVNKEGQIVASYDSIKSVFPLSESLLLIQREDSISLVDENFQEFFVSEDFSLLPWAIGRNGLIPAYHKSLRLYGYIDYNGDIAIPPEYDLANNFIHGYAVVGIDPDKPEHPQPEPEPRQISYTKGLIDRKGKLILPMEYEYIFLDGESPGNVLVSHSGEWSLLSIGNRSLKTTKKFSRTISIMGVHSLTSTLPFISADTDGLGIMNWDGDVVFDPQFSAIRSGSKLGYVVDLEEEKRLFLDPKGRRVREADKFNIYMLDNDYLYYAEGGNVGALNPSFDRILPPIYDTISFNEGIFVVSKDGRCGYVNEDGKKLTELIYSFCAYFTNGYGVARRYNEGE